MSCLVDDFFKAMIIQVLNKNGRSHLVAIVKGKHSIRSIELLPEYVTVPEAEDREDLLSPWFVFNDFSVQNISEEEALSFPGKWKVRQLYVLKMLTLNIPQVPAVLYLERADCQGQFDYSGLSETIDPSILSQDTSISVFVSLPFPQVSFVQSQFIGTETLV
jgi:PAB-dependent poly(A)-specific ribonuclease subunit 2